MKRGLQTVRVGKGKGRRRGALRRNGARTRKNSSSAITPRNRLARKVMGKAMSVK